MAGCWLLVSPNRYDSTTSEAETTKKLVHILVAEAREPSIANDSLSLGLGKPMYS